MRPVEDKKRGGEFVTRLVTPDEVTGNGPALTPLPHIRSVPQRPSLPAPRAGIRRAPSTKAETGYPDTPTPPSGTGAPDLQPPLPPGSSGGAPGPPASSVPQMPPPSMREKLFDQGVISEFAKKAPAAEEKEKKTFTFDTSEYKFLIYNRRLKERIESIWKYPPEASARGIYGDLVLRFTIQKNGRLKQVELVRTSGHKFLDDAAIKALKDGEPYWPLPDEWGMQTYTIVGHFVYTIYGYHIR